MKTHSVTVKGLTSSVWRGGTVSERSVASESHRPGYQSLLNSSTGRRASYAATADATEARVELGDNDGDGPVIPPKMARHFAYGLISVYLL